MSRKSVPRLGYVVAHALDAAIAAMPDASIEEQRDWAVRLLDGHLDLPRMLEDSKCETLEQAILSIAIKIVEDIIHPHRIVYRSFERPGIPTKAKRELIESTELVTRLKETCPIATG